MNLCTGRMCTYGVLRTPPKKAGKLWGMAGCSVVCTIVAFHLQLTSGESATRKQPYTIDSNQLCTAATTVFCAV
jgi:hypothetical protein